MNFLTSDLLFYFFAAIAVIAAILVVLKSNPVGSAMCMAISFCATAGIMFILGAHFLGVIQILVYTGAIMVLFLFIIMLLNVKAEESSFRRPLPMIIGFVIVAVFMLQLGGVIYSIPGAKDAHYCPMAKACGAIDELSLAKENPVVGDEASNKDDYTTSEKQQHCLATSSALGFRTSDQPLFWSGSGRPTLTPLSKYSNVKKGEIVDVSMMKAYDRLRKKDIEIITATREPVIIVGKDGKANIALELVTATTSGKETATHTNVTILNEDGDVIEQIITNGTGMPTELSNTPGFRDFITSGEKLIPSSRCDIAQPVIGTKKGTSTIGASRPVGSSPRMNFPAIDPRFSAINYPVGTTIRTAIDKGDFPDTALLGQHIFLKYNAAFVLVSLSLLVATIGVVVLCRKFNKD